MRPTRETERICRCQASLDFASGAFPVAWKPGSCEFIRICWGGRIRTFNRLIQSQVIEHANGFASSLAISTILAGSGAALALESDDPSSRRSRSASPNMRNVSVDLVWSRQVRSERPAERKPKEVGRNLPRSKEPLPAVASDATEAVEARIHVARGVRVMLDADLAELYGVPTSALNQRWTATRRASRRTSHSGSPPRRRSV